jgi:DNA-binding SARP family transcriptional activator
VIDAHVLGTFEVRIDGQSIVPRANKPRQLLALLVLHAPHPVSVDSLIDELWGGLPPRSALTTLQTYVMQVRRCIDDVAEASVARGGTARCAKDVLLTSYAGYRLAIESNRVDVNGFRDVLAAGLHALEHGHPEQAVGLLDQVLANWHGDALSGVEHGRRLAAESLRMRDDALTALLARNDAQLMLRRHQMLVGELAMLADEYPLDERIHRQYMVACYRSGQPQRALNAFATLRRTLIDELGLEPSARTRGVHQQMLTSDPRMDEPTPVAVTAALPRVLDGAA